MSQTSFDPTARIAAELSLPTQGVKQVLSLLAEGGTVPFIARYRKEATGSLDEVQIRDIQDRRDYIIGLEDRRSAILSSIEEQGKLTPELKAKILKADTKSALEDLYLPYKKKRRTRAMIARERGLEPLALQILAQPEVGDPEALAATFVDPEKDVADVSAALAGARDIVAEALSESAPLRAYTRETLVKTGSMTSEMDPSMEGKPTKFEQYYGFDEPLRTIPSHRFLAMRRGEREGVLRTKFVVDDDAILARLNRGMGLNPGSPFAEQLRLAVEDGYKRLLFPSVESDVRVDLKMRSDREAVDVFANNLKALLMAPLLGEKAVIGVDPGLRTGSKVVAVSATGTYLDTVTIYPARGGRGADEAEMSLMAFFRAHPPAVIAVGNGTGGRETESFIKGVLKKGGLTGISVVSVNEAGASVYSASDVAREEFPDLDLTIRGAISIARRLQDPLAELVKIDPKAIGVGQYQHDVFQPLLARKLDEVVEDCVNQVGVELNTASAPLLARVAGVGPTLAKRIVAHREAEGAFKGRKALLKVKGLGPKTFEQAAGFLRVRGSKNPLDASAVHPERYALVQTMAKDIGASLEDVVGKGDKLKGLDLNRYVGEDVGLPTLKDILAELKKPGRDPRETFEPPKFRDDINEISDLNPGMVLEGVVTNVTAFGAFVDVGVHQDGLVHISQLADHFVKDPNDVVKVGDKIKVRVQEVDTVRRRISLSARSDDGGGGERGQSQGAHGRADQRAEPRGNQNRGGRPGGNRGRGPKSSGRQSAGPKQESFSNNPFAAALKGLKTKS